MIPIDTTILTDGVVTLRPVAPEFCAAMTEAVIESLDSLSPWMGWANPGYNEESHLEWTQRMRQHWGRSLAHEFVILDAVDGSVIGGCGLNNVDTAKGFGNLGYWVRSIRRGEGLAVRATRLVARFAFEQVGLVRVEIVVAVQNHASLRAAEKAGARREGVLRNRMVVRDQVHEAMMHSLIPADFGLPAPGGENG